MAAMGFIRQVAQLPFHRRLDVVTCMRGVVVLASCVLFPVYLRALALHLQSIEKVVSLVALPDIVRAYYVDRDSVDGTALSLMHSVRSVKSCFYGMNIKLAPLFLDLMQVIESTGRMLATWVDQRRLSKAYDLHRRVARNEQVLESRGYTNETYLLTKKIEIAMYIASIGALTVPFLAFSSAYGAQIAVIAEVSYAALCLLHYFYKAHAQDYKDIGSGDSDAGDDDWSPKYKGNGGHGDVGSCRNAEAAVAAPPTPYLDGSFVSVEQQS